MELASFQLSGAKNFEMAAGFWGEICATDLIHDEFCLVATVIIKINVE
jgi:hypothetical protein